jgi:hypothetical protein
VAIELIFFVALSGILSFEVCERES